MKPLNLVAIGLLVWAFLPQLQGLPTPSPRPQPIVPWSPSPAMQSAVEPLRSWASTPGHEAAAKLLCNYYESWRSIARANPDRFPSVKTLYDQNKEAMRYYFLALPQDAPGAKLAVDSSMLALFGDDVTKLIQPTDLQSALSSLAWACKG